MDEIALQTTTFIKWDGSRIVLPNSYLFANMLTNMTRSKEKADVFKVSSGIAISEGCISSAQVQSFAGHESWRMGVNFSKRRLQLMTCKPPAELHLKLLPDLLVQFLVDMGTEAKLLERTEAVAKAVAAENPKDFKGNVAVSAQIGSDKDPMKFYVQVYWCFCYNGMPHLSCDAPAQKQELCCTRNIHRERCQPSHSHIEQVLDNT